MTDTIFALSSGAPPAAIAVVRVSGPAAGSVLLALSGRLPPPRVATRARICAPADGATLDSGLVLWFPGPSTATGEDIAELHLHGGRAVIAAVQRALAAFPGLRPAEAGEFTRRAFSNGRIDLAEAEGLADLLSAETELQRRSAMAMAGGALSCTVESWRDRLLHLAAGVEAALDFADEDDVESLPESFAGGCTALAGELGEWVARPRAEILRDGFRVVLAGPPNSGKSSLFNTLTDSEAAITSPIPGTTRDVITRAVALDGIPFLFVDTAGLREESVDAVEAIGIARARQATGVADLVLWLGAEGKGPVGPGLWEIAARCDDPEAAPKHSPRHTVSAHQGLGLAGLRADLVATASSVLPAPGEVAIAERQARLLSDCRLAAERAAGEVDPLLAAENLRAARVALDRLVGRSGTEDMLDALFGRFCIGK
jgi:tRNA modification GTPase